MTRIAAVLGLYLSVQFDIGVWAARRRKSEDDYLSGTFAGWKVPFLTSLAAALATYVVVGWWERRRSKALD
jgi:hypothetical protein